MRVKTTGRQYLINAVLCVALWCANSAAAAPRSDNDKSIVERCQQSSQLCLDIIPQVLAQTPQASRVWFQHKLLHLEALFHLTMFDELAKELRPWVNKETVPLKFRIHVLVYYAKISNAQGNNADGLRYMERAIATIMRINESNYDPLLTVMVANGLNAMGKYQEGYDLLLPLVDKYQRRPMPKFKHELFENLGHFALQLGNLEEHLDYRLKALSWAQVLASENQIAISLYNVARAYQFLESYENAFRYFEKAELMNALGPSDSAMIIFRRAQMSLAQGNVSAAESYMEVLATKPTFAAYQEAFNKLNQAISDAKKRSL